MRSAIKKSVFFVLTSVLLASCATLTAYYNSLNSLVSEKRYAEAAAFAESSKQKEYGEKNALLFYLDKGFLLHLSGQYEESLKYFEKAKKLAEEHFTKSVTKEAGTFLISDNVRPYYGEDFERALINIFASLNYIFLGKENDALVEARQVDHLLKTLQTNYGQKSVYKEDAFARYLMGMLYENQGQLNDAYISYYNALEAYRDGYKYFNCAAPQELVDDCLRLGQQLGFNDDLAKIKADFTPANRNIPQGYGELVVLDYNGYSPEKIDNFFEIAFGRAWAYVESADVQGEEEQKKEDARAIARSVLASDQIRMAFPKYVDVPYSVASIEVKSADGTLAARGKVADDIGSIAKVNLEDRINRIRIKTIVRATIKFLLAQKVSQKVEEGNGQLAGWLAKKALTVAATATEKADKRSWRSLPDKIVMARLALPKGTQSVKVVFKDRNGSSLSEQTLDNIVIRPGKKTFVAVRSAQ